MFWVGSSEVSGSWKIIAISLPRTCRSSSCFRPTSSRPSSLIEPLTIDPPGGSNPMIDSPVMDLPQPDSPTTPRVSPASICMSTLPTACTTSLVSLMCVDRLSMSSTGAMWPLPLVGDSCSGGTGVGFRRGRLAASQPDVHRVAERVADEVHRHHGQHDAGQNRPDQPPIAVRQVPRTIGQHVSPVYVRVMQAKAEETDVGDGQDRVGDLERHVDDHHAERVREQVPADQPPVA